MEAGAGFGLRWCCSEGLLEIVEIVEIVEFGVDFAEWGNLLGRWSG